MKKYTLFILFCFGNINFMLSMEELSKSKRNDSLEGEKGKTIVTQYGKVHVSDEILALAILVNIQSFDSKASLYNGSQEKFEEVVSVMNALHEIVSTACVCESWRATTEELVSVCQDSGIGQAVLRNKEECKEVLARKQLLLEDGKIPTTVQNIVSSAFTSMSVKTPKLREWDLDDDLYILKMNESAEKCFRTFRCPIINISEQNVWPTLQLFETSD